MRAAWVLGALCLVFNASQLTTALPLFEIPNDYDLDGVACPLKPSYDAVCPQLCVTDLANCPSGLAATCATGLQFCGDGTCQESCEGIANICQCGDPSLAANYFACAAGQLINITHFDPTNKLTQARTLCGQAAGISNTDAINVWGTFDTPSIWAECPPLPEPYFNFTEPMWIAVWALMGAEAAILLFWYAYKHVREIRFNRLLAESVASGAINEKATTKLPSENDSTKEKSSSIQDINTGTSVNESERLHFRGYVTDYFGLFGFGSVVVVTLLFFVFIGIIVGDYYGTVTGVAFEVFLTSDLSSKIFCAVWHIAATWFCVVMLFRKTIRNYFRIESFPHTSPYVQVERRQAEVVFLEDDSKWLKKLREIEQRAVKRLGMDIVIETCPVHLTPNNLRYFEYECMRYVFNATSMRFEPYEFDLGSTNRKLQSWQDGLTSEEAHQRLGLLGSNLIKVYVPTVLMAIIQEFSSFIYLYQMMCMWVWYYFAYYKMGLVQTGIILSAAFIRVILRLRAEHRIKEMAETETKVTVLRDGIWKEGVSSADLVPGDVFEVEQHSDVPCDCVLLSGAVVANESSLTGEAMPIRKFAIGVDDNDYEPNGSSKVNSLFAGTTIAQTMPTTVAGESVNRVRALTLRTGIASEKGMLIHKILFPAPVSFIFNEHLKVAISILLLWGGLAFSLAVYLMGRGNITSWFYGVFVISEIFSPLLPAAFTINQSVCATRLRRKKILCIDLPRINLSGKVRIFCFDKTGTLTREGLEFYGAVAHTTSAGFGERHENPSEIEQTLARGIATCHAVTKVGDQFIGNPVDIESFHAMKWELFPPADPLYLDTLISPVSSPAAGATSSPVHVLRRFEFVHARASQSVAVLDPITEHVHVYLKGSFERVKHLSRSSSVPADYDQKAAQYAQKGCYVLAMAHRDLGVLGKDIEMEDIKTMSRDALEQDSDFCGFILFRNMLKHDTTDAISQLKGGDTRVVMITGDTALTGIFIARQCGMISPNQQVLLGDAVNGSVMWHDVDSGERVNVDQCLEEDHREKHEKQIELAITGRAFELLIQREEIGKYLLHTRVFARMTPTDKVDCVQLHMEKGVTAMCGDGGNDCGALRAAHVGIALSEAEASIVSPFSTSNRSIMQCVELLKQGRSALATSFANFKFLIFYGECMAFWELSMFYFTVIAPQSSWITIDGFITTTMTLAITQAQPAAVLGPSRPTAKPIGAYTLGSVLGVIFINFWFLAAGVAWLFQQDWFICNQFDASAVDSAKWWLIGDNYEAELLVLIIMFQFFNNAAVVNFGSIYRQSWWRNYVLVFIWSAFFVSTSYLILADPNPYSCIFRINCGTAETLVELGYPEPNWTIDPYNSPIGHNVLPKAFRWKLWGYVLANSLATVLWERVVMQHFGKKYIIRRNKTNPPKDRILFKL
ncbi:hypothetical protein J3Q64DRAFT_1398603 [Phycomyces blakesleeanus]|uniref:Cation-transporting P-type ATPase N-terminal domain-containing protein n=1 Tax=Phycomyces blakesleeanus TaxID=4837 RepID=A0ABR3B4F4_PHYBL